MTESAAVLALAHHILLTGPVGRGTQLAGMSKAQAIVASHKWSRAFLAAAALSGRKGPDASPPAWLLGRMAGMPMGPGTATGQRQGPLQLQLLARGPAAQEAPEELGCRRHRPYDLRRLVEFCPQCGSAYA